MVDDGWMVGWMGDGWMLSTPEYKMAFVMVYYGILQIHVFPQVTVSETQRTKRSASVCLGALQSPVSNVFL